MKDRYTDRRIYFEELARTSTEYISRYISAYKEIRSGHHVIEIGCGEGGNLVPFAGLGCDVCGIDISKGKISDARTFFQEKGLKGEFICSDFIRFDIGPHIGKYDIVIMHDVIEHISPADKHAFMSRAKALLRPSGVMMSAFPAWNMPFGGHQQICRSRLCRLPFIHLLPERWYRGYLKTCNEKEDRIDELMSIRRAGMSIESFEELCSRSGLKIQDRTLWLVNPHYKAKFSLRPVRLHMPWCRWLRNHLSTSCFHILTIK
ncbi:MAG: class I SAM-dependent methyltransferase [Bacteroidales bacterium]|nr:class I SAM-dependent methyltransferase [Bacteroidales bacterium]